jgi:hypothetical protein
VFYFKWKNDKSIINLIFVIAGYTYGPLLGLFSFGILTKRAIKEKVVPFVCILSPLFCYLLDKNSEKIFSGYLFGNEMLILNGLITFVLLFITSRKNENSIVG